MLRNSENDSVTFLYLSAPLVTPLGSLLRTLPHCSVPEPVIKSSSKHYFDLWLKSLCMVAPKV